MDINFNNTWNKLTRINENSSSIVTFLLPNATNGFLSNWYPSRIEIFNNIFNSGEQAFMWAKADTFDDEESKEQIMNTTDPKKLKALGRKIKNYDDTIWSNKRISLMKEIVKAKFTQNPDLMKKLLATKDLTIVEANAYDKFWACGLKASDPSINDVSKWSGKNVLGKILMEVRDSNYNMISEAISLEEEKNIGYISYGVKATDENSSVKMLDIILQSDQIKSSEAQDGLYASSEQDAFVSTSRDYLSHIKNNRQRPVGIILDGTKLSAKYKINPINWATLELNKEESRLSLKELKEYTNVENPEQKVYKVQFACYGSFFVSREVFEVLEKIMHYYNATETINRAGEKTNLGTTHGFVGDHHLGQRGNNKGMPFKARWRVTKGYFYNVPTGGGVNISKGTFDKYRNQLAQDGINLEDDVFISELVHNKVLDETEERIIQKATFTYDSKSYTKNGILRKGAKAIQSDTFFNIKDCIKLVLLPIRYKNCWDSNGKDDSYDTAGSHGYIVKNNLNKPSLVKDIVALKQTIISKGLEEKIFWITPKSTNADVNRAIK